MQLQSGVTTSEEKNKRSRGCRGKARSITDDAIEAAEIRDGRKQTLSECLKKEFRLTINILRAIISGDVFEGIRALTIDKDNSQKWDPLTLCKKLDLVFEPFEEALEFNIPENEEQRWTGKYEDSVYA